MALITCPECGKEISDTNTKCPFCGFIFKKETKRKALLIILIAVVICIVAAAAIYTLILKPNQLLKQAENLIVRGKYSEADIILTEVPDSKRKEALVTQIVLHEAEEALESGNYELAEEKLNMISPDAVDEALLYEIKDEKAEVILGQGRYIEADALYAEMPQTEEIVTLRAQLFYESRILPCVAMIQDNLIFPESFVLEEALLSESGGILDESQSNDEQKVYVYGEPKVLLHYRAQSRGGSMVDGFVMFSWSDGRYNMGTVVDTLTPDEEVPALYEYMDSKERSEYVDEQSEIILINLRLADWSWFENYDMDRMNAVIQAGCAENVQMIGYNEIVPQPTPRIVTVTPAPTALNESEDDNVN